MKTSMAPDILKLTFSDGHKCLFYYGYFEMAISSKLILATGLNTVFKDHPHVKVNNSKTFPEECKPCCWTVQSERRQLLLELSSD